MRTDSKGRTEWKQLLTICIWADWHWKNIYDGHFIDN
jgi:hypothetical protein